MSGCGCNDGSCEDTKPKQNISETDSCSGTDLNTETNKKSCCDKGIASESKEQITVDACGGSQPCSAKAKSCCGTDTSNQQQNINKETGRAALISDYTIPKMDCSAEEQMVRMSLSSLESVNSLIFDLPNRNLKVLYEGNTDLITSKLEALGFGAKLNSTEIYNDNKNSKQTSTYIIPKMDCSAEEQMVRMALAPLSEVKALVFDLPNRKLQVFHTDGISEITTKLEGLGFGAKLESTVESIRTLPDSPDPTRQAKVLKILLAINAVLFVIEFKIGRAHV